MIIRIADFIRHGTLDNSEPNQVLLTLHLKGRRTPLHVQLQGNCLQDLAGCKVHFRNPDPVRTPHELERSLPPQLVGTTGDITASLRVAQQDKPNAKSQLKNTLYIEFFVNRNDMFVIESDCFELEVSLPQWTMDSYGEQIQIMENQQRLRNHVQSWIQGFIRFTKDDDCPDSHWDKRLREAEATAIAHQEVCHKYRFAQDRPVRIAFVMGWDDVMDELISADESGEMIPDISEDPLHLNDVLDEEESHQVQECSDNALFRQIQDVSETCQECFARELTYAQITNTTPSEPAVTVFSCLRYITPRVLSSLLQLNESERTKKTPDYDTMRLRIAKGIDIIKHTKETLDLYQDDRTHVDKGIYELFDSLENNMQTFLQSLILENPNT